MICCVSGVSAVSTAGYLAKSSALDRLFESLEKLVERLPVQFVFPVLVVILTLVGVVMIFSTANKDQLGLPAIAILAILFVASLALFIYAQAKPLGPPSGLWITQRQFEDLIPVAFKTLGQRAWRQSLYGP